MSDPSVPLRPAVHAAPRTFWQDTRGILQLAWPTLIGQLAIIAFGVIDTAMVGRVSAEDLAALGLGASIYISIYVALTGILTALSPIVGNLFGAGQREAVGEAVRQAVWLALALAVLGALLLAFPGPLLHVAKATPELTARATAYLRILAFGLPASLLFRVYNALSTAIGRPRFVMMLQVAALALKIPANLWLIFGGWGVPPLGGPGCALASTLINWCTAVAGIAMLATRPTFRAFGIFARVSVPDARQLWALLRLGVPMGFSYLIEVTAYTFMALFISRFGTSLLAAHQIAGNVAAVLYMTPMSIGIAAGTLVAQTLGAGESVRAALLARRGILLATSIGIAYAAALMLWRYPIAKAYTNNATVAAAAVSLLLIVAIYHVFDAVQVSTAFVLRSYRVTVIPTLIYAIALWGVGLGGGYLLGFNVPGHLSASLTGARGFWIANSASLGVAALLLLIYWHRLSRREVSR